MISNIKLTPDCDGALGVKDKIKNIMRDGKNESVHFSTLGYLIVKNKAYLFTFLIIISPV